MNRLTRSRRRRILSVMALVAAFASGTAALACNVPVFRFALERWRPDAYRVIVLHRGPLSDAHRELLAPLEQLQDKDAANLVLRTVDITTLEKSDQADASARAGIRDEVWSKLMEGQAWLVVQYPVHLRIEVPVWEGPLSREAVSSIVDSPVRSELIKRLLAGQTTVWVVLESGNKEKDDAAAQLVETELGLLEQTLKLPELTSDPSDELLASTPLKVAFSVLRVPHGSPEEQAMAGMLIRSEPDLIDRPDPIVFPVFGRGRALLPLIGAGISNKNVQEAAAFLVGPCSCQVKELNPGFDLLLSAEWDALLSQGGQQLTAIQTRGLPFAPQSTAVRTEPELVPIPTGSQATETTLSHSAATTPPASNGSWLLTGGILAGAVVFIVVLSALNAGKS